MATGREMQSAKRIEEYSLCAELCRMGFIATTFAGNVPDFDILAIDDESETKSIQAKDIECGSWQFDAGKFLDISVSRDGIQTIEHKKRLQNPDLICISTELISQGKDEFCISRLRDLQNVIFRNHNGWLKKHGGKRPRNPKSTHTAVFPDNSSKDREDWQLLKE